MTPAVEMLVKAARRSQCLRSINYRIDEAERRGISEEGARLRARRYEIEDQLASAISADAESRSPKVKGAR